MKVMTTDQSDSSCLKDGQINDQKSQSLNLNTCIDEMLMQQEKKWRRRRLSKTENAFLEEEYQKNPNWDVAKKK